MKYGLTDLPRLVRTPPGRAELRVGLLCQGWPLLSRLALAYRRRIVPRTCLVAVTGSHGKTTTTRAIASALGVPLHRRASWNYSVFVAWAVLRIGPGQRQAVVEVGAHSPGEIAAYARVIRPDVAVVTCIGSEHRNSLRTLEGTRQEKSALLAALPPDGLAVLNGDDPNVLWMRARTRARVVTFGLGEANQVRASQVRTDWPDGTRFTLHLDGQQHQVRTRLVGPKAVYPILAAVAVAQHQRLPLGPALARLERLEPTPGRLQSVPLPNGAVLLRDDYKGTLETIELALEALDELPARRKIAVLGDISEPPAGKYAAYRRLGRRAGEVADRIVCVASHARRYKSGFWAGGLQRDDVQDAEQSVVRAIELLRDELRPGDVVLLKGQGTQRLERIALGLQGRAVRCDIRQCRMTMPRCVDCSWLERGWTAPPPP